MMYTFKHDNVFNHMSTDTWKQQQQTNVGSLATYQKTSPTRQNLLLWSLVVNNRFKSVYHRRLNYMKRMKSLRYKIQPTPSGTHHILLYPILLLIDIFKYAYRRSLLLIKKKSTTTYLIQRVPVKIKKQQYIIFNTSASGTYLHLLHRNAFNKTTITDMSDCSIAMPARRAYALLFLFKYRLHVSAQCFSVLLHGMLRLQLQCRFLFRIFNHFVSTVTLHDLQLRLPR